MGSLGEEIARQKAASAARRPPEVNEALAAGIEHVRQSGVLGRVLRPGDRAPGFRLANQRGEEIELGDLLGRRAVVLSFYRGAW